jgi:metal-responsive CopG/Arc/MetJ family transcriptional regulator
MNRQRGERLQIMLSPEELEALDDFRFKHRMPSRASAIRELLRRGLADNAKMAQGKRSGDFGVIADANLAETNDGSSVQ